MQISAESSHVCCVYHWELVNLVWPLTLAGVQLDEWRASCLLLSSPLSLSELQDRIVASHLHCDHQREPERPQARRSLGINFSGIIRENDLV